MVLSLQTFQALGQRLLQHQDIRALATVVPLTLLFVPLKVWMHEKSYAWQGLASDQQRLLHKQEQIRQVVSNTLWIGSTILSYLALETVMRRPWFTARFKQPHKIVTLALSNIPSQLQDALLRPPIVAYITKRALGQQAFSQAAQLEVMASQQAATPKLNVVSGHLNPPPPPQTVFSAHPRPLPYPVSARPIHPQPKVPLYTYW